MREGVYLYKELRGHDDYYETVPLHVTVAEYADDAHPHAGDDPERQWSGHVDCYAFPRLWFDDGPTYKLTFKPSKDMNVLYLNENTVEVTTGCWVELRTCEEVPVDA